MSYRSERFNRRMKSLETTASGRDTSKWRALSDGGLGVERVLTALDGDEDVPADASGTTKPLDEDERDELLFNAEMRLVEAHRRHLIPVLLLIAENGPDRERSLRRIPARTYFRHRDELLAFFTGVPAS